MIGASQLSLLAVTKVGFDNEPRSWGVAVIAVIAVQVRRRKCGAVVRLQGKGTQSCLHERQGAHLVLHLLEYLEAMQSDPTYLRQNDVLPQLGGR